MQLRLSRQGTVWSGEQRNTISVEKTVMPLENYGWQVVYRIQNLDGPACPMWFASEMAFGFATSDVKEPVEYSRQTQWLRRDEAFGLTTRVNFDVPTDVWEFPLQTVSLSEEGFERTYQGTVLLAHARLTLHPGQYFVRTWSVRTEPS
jgi:4-alpha-glucanotransferase